MVQIWCMEPYPTGDPRLPHHCYPPKKLTPDELTKRTGASYYKLDLDDKEAAARRIGVMKIERSFKKEDTFTLDGANTIDFEDKLAELFEEIESHEDQARLITEGAAYFDVEDLKGDWIRILAEYGDLIVIPAGRPHRMTTTAKNFVKIRRFFKDDSDRGVRVGNILYTSGASGVDPETGKFAPGGIEGETRQTLINLGNVLKALELIKTTVLLANLDDLPAVNKVYAEFFTTNFPARVPYQVGRLPRDALIEIDAVAVVGKIVEKS